jgi:hypothetical protein
VTAQPRAFFAQLKRGETERKLGNWNVSAAAYLRAIELEPLSALGFGGLVLTLAESAEAAGTIRRGMGRTWIARLETAVDNERELGTLIAETHRAGCGRCAQAIQWLALRRFPKSDQALLQSATLALRYDQPEMALVFLREVRDRRQPDHARLERDAQARLNRAGSQSP